MMQGTSGLLVTTGRLGVYQRRCHGGRGVRGSPAARNHMSGASHRRWVSVKFRPLLV
jgi:hypothetical protein